MTKNDVNSTLDSIVEMLIQEERYPEAAKFLDRLSEEVIERYETTLDGVIDKYLKTENEEELEKGIRLHSAAEEENCEVRDISEVVGELIDEEDYKRAVKIYDIREDEEGFKKQIRSRLEACEYDKAGGLVKAAEDSESLADITVESYVNDAIKKKNYEEAVGLINNVEGLNFEDYVNEQVENKKYSVAAKLIQVAELDVDEIIEDEKIAAKVKHYLKE